MVNYPYIIVGQTSNPSDINVILDKVQNAVDSIRTRGVTAGTVVGLTFASFVSLYVTNANIHGRNVSAGTVVATYASFANGVVSANGKFYVASVYA